jgi:hypothetical protein
VFRIYYKWIINRSEEHKKLNDMKTNDNNWSYLFETETPSGKMMFFTRNGEFRMLMGYAQSRGCVYRTSIKNTDINYLFVSNNEASDTKLEDARNSELISKESLLNAGRPSFFEKIRRRKLLRQYK